MYKKEENGWTQLGGLVKAKHAHKKKRKRDKEQQGLSGETGRRCAVTKRLDA